MLNTPYTLTTDKACMDNFPVEIQTAIKQMTSWASPLYHKEPKA